MNELGTVLSTMVVLSLAASGRAWDVCQVREPRQATVDAAGASRVVVRSITSVSRVR